MTRSREEAQTLARRLARQLSASPGRFAELRAAYCEVPNCSGPPDVWERGRDFATLERAVTSLKVGQVGLELVETPRGFHVVRRENAAQLPELPREQFEFELPVPDFEDLSTVLLQPENRVLAARTRELARAAAVELALRGEQRTRFDALLEKLATTFEQVSAQERVRAYERTSAELAGVLGPQLHARFQGFVTAWVERAQLG